MFSGVKSRGDGGFAEPRGGSVGQHTTEPNKLSGSGLMEPSRSRLGDGHQLLRGMTKVRILT